jgi:hypothetical protein
LRIVLDSNCQKKWSLIKAEFEGRTENALKNRYNLLLDKQKKATPLEREIDLIIENLKGTRRIPTTWFDAATGRTGRIETILPDRQICPNCKSPSPNQSTQWCPKSAGA